MSFCIIIDEQLENQNLHRLANNAENIYRQLHPDFVTTRFDWESGSVLSSQTKNSRGKHWVHMAHIGMGLVSSGVWLCGETLATGQEERLLSRAHERGFNYLINHLEGCFCLGVIDFTKRSLDLMVDPAGSYHVYRVHHDGALIVSDNALLLAALTSSQLNPQAVLSFIVSGVIYGNQSLWQDFVKLEPAEHLHIQPFQTRVNKSRYWTFSDVAVEQLKLSDAADQLAASLTQNAKRISRNFPKILCDVTGGYDSRATLAGFLLGNCSVGSTVSGPETSADAQVAQAIARRFSLSHRRIDHTRQFSFEDLQQALLLTDGEYDVFEYAGIAATHNKHVAAGYDISINGSFGELARGYWWELLFPRIGAQQPLAADRLARNRFVVGSYAKNLFGIELAKMDLAEQITQIISEQTAPLSNLPNTRQMDNAYFMMRMQRWQGRIASGTNRIWHALSPFAMRSTLEIVLASQANTRLRSLLIREMLYRHIPQLGNLPLEHGYPAVPATLTNFYRFSPVIGYYWHRVAGKVSRILPIRSKLTVGQSSDKLLSVDPNLSALCSVPNLLSSGLFSDQLHSYMLSEQNTQFVQWRRLLTLEMAISKVVDLKQKIAKEPPSKAGGFE